MDPEVEKVDYLLVIYESRKWKLMPEFPSARRSARDKTYVSPYSLHMLRLNLTSSLLRLSAERRYPLAQVCSLSPMGERPHQGQAFRPHSAFGLQQASHFVPICLPSFYLTRYTYLGLQAGRRTALCRTRGNFLLPLESIR